jgi:uncharacterized protein (DUF58 family)
LRLPSAALRLIRLLFPLTVRGLVISALAAGLLAAGIARADLAGLFWGSSFLLVTLYALVAGHVFLFSARRRNTAESISVHLPAGGLDPADDGEAVIAARLPRVFPPGFSVHLALPLSWHTRKIEGVRLSMRPGASQDRVAFHAIHRGVYEGRGVVVEARDVLGLTAHRLSFSGSHTLTVHPHVGSPRELLGLVEQTDEATVDSRRRRRSEELLEARKYYPGDDVRRLNWKVYAHMDELFLRIGEEVPPPESRILFVLDTTTNPLVPRSLDSDYLDRLVESCASVMVHLASRGLEVAFSRPGVRECRSFGEGSRAALLAALAGAWWTAEDWAPELPAKALQAVVFTSPGSPGLPRIMSAIRARGWRASIFLQDLQPAAASATLHLRDLLFVPGEARGPAVASGGRGGRGARTPPGASGSRRERTVFADALERDMAMYSGSAQRTGHAAET